MKKLIGAAVVIFLIMTSMTNNPASAQTDWKDADVNMSIPADVKEVFERSCVKCHLESGNFKAKMRFNLSRWDKFSTGKQAKKAEEILYQVTKEKMPPEKFRISHPKSSPGKREIKTIKEWAESLQK
jgi:mono/diheme cytochrome c family protein